LFYQTEVLIVGQICVWLIDMKATKPSTEKETFYIFGSGLMPVPSARMNEVTRLKHEFHASEADRALFLARMRRAV
jgi:hypothetical protein